MKECGRCRVWKMWSVENEECGKRLSSSSVPRSFFMTTIPPFSRVWPYCATKTDPNDPRPISSLSVRSAQSKDGRSPGRSLMTGDESCLCFRLILGNLKAIAKELHGYEQFRFSRQQERSACR